MTITFKGISLGLIVSATMSIGAADAATTTTANLAVTATVLDTCIVTTGAALTFVTVGPTGVTNESTPGSIEVVCTASRSALTVTLGGGGAAVSGGRRMSDGSGSFLPYAVHADSGHSTPIAVNGEIYNGAVSAAVPVVIPVYGQVPSGAYTSGVYTDTVVVTLAY